MGGLDAFRDDAGPSGPRPEEISDLLDRAARHPLGTDFLQHGSLDAVAATFRVHAFVVDAARDALDAGSAVPVVGTAAAAACASGRE